ncbi:MAG TPA: alpha/beta hydrolase [Steroidobacteraceae bacterium]|nr:alpha/beta hydrolase [Steroidobacteraceae bacterium]
MDAIHDSAPGAGADRIALVMLPGARDRAQDLVAHGFVQALRTRDLAVDAVAVDARFDHYLEHSIVAQLEEDIIAPLRRKGLARIWLMGISLGSTGALSYAREHAGAVEGMILLAPFLGTRGLIAEITQAGGLRHWQPGTIAPQDDERRLLAWLRQYRAGDPALPRICLGYGTEDRYAPASLMLAQQLPERQVMTIPGGHDWPTWLKLWERWLDSDALASPGKP